MNRLHQAWQLRHDVHLWLKSHIGSTLAEIAAAFPAVGAHALRKTMVRLRRDLDVVMINRPANVGCYSAVSNEIRPLQETIDRLRDGGRRCVKFALAGSIKARRANRPAAADDKTAGIAKPLKAAKAVAPAKLIKAPQPAKADTCEGDDEPRIQIVAPGHIRYRPGAKPIPNQGGQGALRRTVHIDCSRNY